MADMKIIYTSSKTGGLQESYRGEGKKKSGTIEKCVPERAE